MAKKNVPLNRPKAYSYIRMSTPEQRKGHSLKRQLEKSRKYAAEHDLVIDTEFKLIDPGRSAYTGAHIATGELGAFLRAIEAGKIERGSCLIVESLDRLSRRDVLEAQSMFMGILTAGVNVATLVDNHFYDAENPTVGDLIISVVAFARSNEESVHKSIRLSDAWGDKREKASTRKLTSICPAWMKLSRNRFVVDADRAAVVTKIFQDSANGVGNFTIARLLNREKVAPFGKSEDWHPSYIAKILNNRAVIGEFQPHKYIRKGHRIPEGDPIVNYFPAIVDPELFHRAQDQRRKREFRGAGAGRKGLKISNLFTGIIRCSYCDGSMKFENKGRPPRGRNYFACERAKRTEKCHLIRWRYDDFEKSFLTFIREVDLKGTLSAQLPSNERDALIRKIEALSGQRIELKKKMDFILSSIEDGSPAKQFLMDRLNRLASDDANLQKQEANLKNDLANLEANFADFYNSKDDIKQLIESLQNDSSEDTVRKRLSIAAKLRSLVSSIQVAAGGDNPIDERYLARIMNREEPEFAHFRHPESVVDHFRLVQSMHPHFFTVNFKNGTSRSAFPLDEDPYSVSVETFSLDDGRSVSVDADGREGFYETERVTRFVENRPSIHFVGPMKAVPVEMDVRFRINPFPYPGQLNPPPSLSRMHMKAHKTRSPGVGKRGGRPKLSSIDKN